MIFLDFDPRTPPTRVPLFGGVGVGMGGVKISLCIVATACVFGPGSRRTFFLYMDPLTQAGSRVPTLGTPPSPKWPLASFHAGQAV